MFSFVNLVTGTLGSSTATGSLFLATITTTAGNTLIWAGAKASSMGNPTGITDSLGNTWTIIGQDTLIDISAVVAPNVAAGTCTVTVSGTGSALSSSAWILTQYSNAPQDTCVLMDGPVFPAAGTTVSGYGIGGQITTNSGTVQQTILSFCVNTATSSLAWTIAAGTGLGSGTSRGTSTYSTTITLNLSDGTFTSTGANGFFGANYITSTCSGTTTTGTLGCLAISAIVVQPKAVNVGYWLGTAVTSNAGTPVTYSTGGTVGTVTGTINVNVVEWNGVTPNNLVVGNVPEVGYIFSGTATGQSSNTVQFSGLGAIGLNSTSSTYQGLQITILNGTGSNQSRLITGYTYGTTTGNGTGTCTVVPNWTTQPGANSVCVISPWSGVDVETWLTTAVTSNAGVPLVDVAAGTITTVTGNVLGTVAAVTTASNVGTVTSVTSATVIGTPTVNVVDWLGTAVTSNAGIPVVYTTNTVNAVVPVAGTGSFVYVQSTSATLTSTLTMSASSTAGDVIVVADCSYQGAVATSVVDNLGNNYVSYGTTSQSGRGTFCVFVATNVAAGTATITFSGASAADNNLIASEYNAPTSGYFVTGTAFQVTPPVGTLWPYVWDHNPVNGTIPSAVMIPITYCWNNYGTWTLSTGTVRQFTHEPDGATFMLGDLVMNPPATTTMTVTSTMNSAGIWPLVTISLVAYNNQAGITSTNVNVVDWLGTAVTSNAGVPVVYTTNGTIATVTGTVAAVTTVTSVGTVTSVSSATVVGTPTVNVVDWLGTAVTSSAGTPVVVATNTQPVNVVQWLGTAVTSSAGVPITIMVGTVTATVPSLSTNVNVQQWLGTAVTSNAGVPIVDVAAGTVTTVTGNVLGTVAAVTTATGVGTATLVLGGTIGTATVVGGTVTTVTGNVVGSVGSVVGTVTATVPTLSTNVNVQEWLGTAVTSNAGIPVVYTTNTTTAIVVGGTIATVVNPVSISTGQLTIQRDKALHGFSFPMYNSTTGTLQTGLTVSSQVSIDGGSLGSTANSITEIGSGLYSLNLAASDTNGTVLTFVFTATGAASSVITAITQA